MIFPVEIDLAGALYPVLLDGGFLIQRGHSVAFYNVT
jgi:hypothetical protein